MNHSGRVHLTGGGLAVSPAVTPSCYAGNADDVMQSEIEKN